MPGYTIIRTNPDKGTATVQFDNLPDDEERTLTEDIPLGDDFEALAAEGLAKMLAAHAAADKADVSGFRLPAPVGERIEVNAKALDVAAKAVGSKLEEARSAALEARAATLEAAPLEG